MLFRSQILASNALLKKANLHILTGHLESCVRHALEHEEQVDERLSEVETLLSKLLK